MTEQRTAEQNVAFDDYDEALPDDGWEDEDPLQRDALAGRPPRKLVTPVTAGLGAVLVAGLGFIGGVEVQKDHGGTSHGTNAGAGALPGRGGGTPPGGAAGRGRAGARGGRGGAAGFQQLGTMGSVANTDGNTIYLKGNDGTTVKVGLGSNGKVTRTAATNAKSIHPGDTVIVQGRKGRDGTIKATQVTATSATAGSAGPPGGLFGGGAGQRGGAAPPGLGSGSGG
jgi:hypothetical protein